MEVSDREQGPKIVFWHRELPPLDAALAGTYRVEADSSRVQGAFAHRDDLWQVCQREVMATAEHRLIQEVVRLGGQYAHVYQEVIEPKHDAATDEAWLHGQFDYVLYRRTPDARETPPPSGTAG